MTSPIWHPFTQHAIAPDSVHIDRAAGAYLYGRDVDGSERTILDAISSWWVITHGHCHPKIVSAVQAQAGKLDQVIFAGFTHAPAEELAQRLVSVTGRNFDHVFYSDSGSTAVEVALKQAIGYWAHSGKKRHKIIALEGGYHGDTFGTMSTGARGAFNDIYAPYLFDVIHVPVPVKGQEAAAFQALEDVLKAHKDDVAAFIFEPLVQGAGGMVMYEADALNTMAQMCRADDVLLIADEVMTGFGRTGTMFACEQAGFWPDIMCLSKGLTGGFLPLGVTMCTRAIYDAFYHKDRAKMFFHSSSFTGNPMACAAANASLSIWADEDVQGRIDRIVEIHKSAALQFAAQDHITNIRQTGTILAVDLVVGSQGYLSDIQPRLYEFFMSQNILLRPLGNTVYVLPAYCMENDDLRRVYDVIGNAEGVI